MSSKQKCPDCRQWLDKNADECYCGWVPVSSSKNLMIDHRCVYEASGKRCPLAGSNCFSRHGGDAPWYCLGHYQNLKDPKKCYEILMYALNNFESLMEDFIDWRVKLYPEEYSARKSQIKKLAQTLNLKEKDK